MALIVQKYGGTSVGSTERIRSVARRVARYHREGHQLVVVVSAMSGETNRLLALAKPISPDPDPRELDVIAATGEPGAIGLARGGGGGEEHLRGNARDGESGLEGVADPLGRIRRQVQGEAPRAVVVR